VGTQLLNRATGERELWKVPVGKVTRVDPFEARGGFER
jgi:hypothetical protein